MNELLFNFYKMTFLSINRGNHCGIVINAKPLYYITIINQINKKEELIDNRIPFSAKLNNAYICTCKEYQPNTDPTPFFKPYYYSKSEPFYHLKYKKEPPRTSLSAKSVRENIEYAYLDNALWDLLQEPQIQQQLRETLETHFLTK